MDDKILGMINKSCKDKTNIKLTVGTLDADDNKEIRVFDQSGEVQNENYIYEIGSITKTFTCSLFAKYIYEQKMSLDDPVSKYVDGLDDGKYYPTLKRLATHTAGYARIHIYEEKPYLTLCHQRHTSTKGHDMGLGWIISKSNNHVLWHNGGTGAFRSYVAIDKQKKVASVALANYLVTMDEIGSSILEHMQTKRSNCN